MEWARHKSDRCGSRVGAVDAIDDACRMAVVLGAISGIDLFVDIGVWLFHESNLFVHPAGLDAALMPCLDAVEPGGSAPVHGSDVEIVADTDHPDDHRVS